MEKEQLQDGKLEKVNISSRIKNRESNIELLRILCMLGIIAHHCVVHGGGINMEYCSNKLICILLLPGGKIGFTCFLAISTWYLVDSKYKTAKFLKMWLEVFLYSIVFTVIASVVTNDFSLKKVFSSLLPIAGNSHGYAASYLLLYLLIPFLGKIVKNISKFQARLLLGILFYAQVLSQIIGYINDYYQSIYSEILLFIFCYILSLNLKRWPIKLINDKVVCGLTFATIWLMICQIFYLQVRGNSRGIFNFISAITKDESSILYIIAGYALFLLFRKIKIKHSYIINSIATTTFGILLIHDHNYFRTVVWNNIFKCSTWYYSRYFILKILLCVCDIFIICGCIDYIRQVFIERPLFNNKKLVEKCKRMDDKIYEE
ncbi:acyltransferase family protein [Lachnospiraceae bacterium HCP1S3_C3]